jgi:hypothetical protein
MTCRPLTIVAAALLAFCFVVGAGAATRPKTFRDPAGDVNGGPGPDVVAVTVSHTATAVTFRVRFASAPPLRMSTRQQWVDMLLVGIDVPPLGPAPTATGWLGVNYYFGLHAVDPVARFRKMGSQATPARLPTVIRGATATVTVPRAKLGSPRWFAFNVAAGRETDVEGQGGGDMAPAQGSFRYALTG